MAHIYKLKYGSPAAWSYIDLTDDNHGARDYVPATPLQYADDVTESGVWTVLGSSVLDLEMKIRAIENVFRKAAAYDLDNIGAYQVRLTCQLSGDSRTWESPIYEGRLELPSSTLGVDWANTLIDVTLIWRRAAWWEQLVDIPISNSNGSNVTSGLRIYNRGDATGSSPTKQENFIDVAAGVILGDLPAPAAIEINLDTSGNYSSMNAVTVLHNAKTLAQGGVQPPILLEGEDEVLGLTDTTDATRSGGKYCTYPMSSPPTINFFQWTGGNLALIQTGTWLKVLLCAKVNGTIKIRPRIDIGGIYYGPTSVVVGTNTKFIVYDLGLVYMPPNNHNLTYGGGFKIGFEFIGVSGNSVSVDYALFYPIDSLEMASLDSYTVVSETIIIDPHDGLVCTAITTYLVSYGTLFNGVYLEPGLAQRLIFKFTSSGEDFQDRTGLVKLKCWQRKLTL